MGREDEIRSAFANGLPGGMATFAAAGMAPLIKLEVPAWCAGPWTVTLAAMTSPNGQPTDMLTFRMKSRIKWGVGNAFSEALIDYPWGGAVFTVDAASLTVYAEAPQQGLFPASTGGAPNVGAFASPGGRARGFQVLTDQPQDATAAVRFNRPAFATSYRLFCVNRDGRNTEINSYQLDGSLAPMSFDTDALVPWFGQELPAAPARMGGGIDLDTWIPLHPATTRIEVQAAPAAVSVIAQWRIEL